MVRPRRHDPSEDQAEGPSFITPGVCAQLGSLEPSHMPTAPQPAMWGTRVGQAGAMERVAIVGPGGAGKSTFARSLGERTGLPVFHLDRFFWKPGWVETPREEWRHRQSELVAAERWIADGNYGGTFDERFARANTVIIVARPRWACVTAAIARISPEPRQGDPGEGCPERFDLTFYRWIWNYEHDSRPRLDTALHRHDHLDVVELKTRKSNDPVPRRRRPPLNRRFRRGAVTPELFEPLGDRRRVLCHQQVTSAGQHVATCLREQGLDDLGGLHEPGDTVRAEHVEDRSVDA